MYCKKKEREKGCDAAAATSAKNSSNQQQDEETRSSRNKAPLEQGSSREKERERIEKK